MLLLYSADLANGPAAGDLEREIISFVEFASTRNLNDSSGIQCLSCIYEHSLEDGGPVSQLISCAQNSDNSSCDRRIV